MDLLAKSELGARYQFKEKLLMNFGQIPHGFALDLGVWKEQQTAGQATKASAFNGRDSESRRHRLVHYLVEVRCSWLHLLLSMEGLAWQNTLLRMEDVEGEEKRVSGRESHGAAAGAILPRSGKSKPQEKQKGFQLLIRHPVRTRQTIVHVDQLIIIIGKHFSPSNFSMEQREQQLDFIGMGS